MNKYQMKKILFLHGLESGPHGTKVRILREKGYEVVVPEMLIGKKFMLNYVWKAVFIGCGLLVLSPPLSLLYVIGLGVGYKFYSRWLVSKMFYDAVEVQKQALRDHNFDLMIGSSFGGAIGVHLLQSEEKLPPAILLCPAYKLIAKYGNVHELENPIFHKSNKCLLVHGENDQTVAIEDSIDLAVDNEIELFQVPDDHRLKKYFPKIDEAIEQLFKVN